MPFSQEYSRVRQDSIDLRRTTPVHRSRGTFGVVATWSDFRVCRFPHSHICMGSKHPSTSCRDSTHCAVSASELGDWWRHDNELWHPNRALCVILFWACVMFHFVACGSLEFYLLLCLFFDFYFCML